MAGFYVAFVFPDDSEVHSTVPVVPGVEDYLTFNSQRYRVSARLWLLDEDGRLRASVSLRAVRR